MKRLFFILLAGVWAMSVLGQSFDEEAGMRFYKDKQYEAAVPYLQKAAKAGNRRTCPLKIWDMTSKVSINLR